MRHWFKKTFWIIDSPLVPFSLGEFKKDKLFDDIHTARLAKLLEFLDPELLERWHCDVLTSAYRTKQEKEKLDGLISKKEELAAEIARHEALIDPRLDTLPPQPKEPWYSLLLTIGLSFMLFLGFSEFLGVDLMSLAPDQYFSAFMALLGAICINIAEKLSVEKLAKATRSFEPRRNYSDVKHYKNIIPFWHRYRVGDSAIWLATLIVALETGFAAPGIMSLLPPMIAEDPIIKIVVFLAAGLAALVNVSLAFGIALEAISWQQQKERVIQKRENHMSRKKKDPNVPDIIEVYNDEIKAKADEAKARKEEVIEQIKDQKQEYLDMKVRARLEHERWEIAVRKLLRENKNKVEQFNSGFGFTETTDNPTQRNGHKPIESFDEIEFDNENQEV